MSTAPAEQGSTELEKGKTPPFSPAAQNAAAVAASPGRPAVAALARAPLRAAARVWAQGQDTWTLLPRKLTDRDLRRQLEVESYRLGARLPYVTLAADASVGAQLARHREDLSRYHGFYIVDGYAELELLSGLSVNVNVTALNPSASDGYRFSSELLPGAALHLDKDLLTLAGSPVHLEFIAPDLDLVTVGQGLLIEETPLEGFAFGFGWAGFELKGLFAGRVFWDDDDFLTVSLSALHGAAGIAWSTWLTEVLPPPLSYPSSEPSLQGATSPHYGPGRQADYISAYGAVALAERLRLSGEYGARLETKVRHALLARADYLAFDWSWLAVHVGYQFRYYGQGFGPRRTLVTPSTAPALPYRENAYVTNSFEYLGQSSDFKQWSHTFMAEAEAAVAPHVVVFGQTELWLRYLSGAKNRVVYIQRFGQAPGSALETYYRAGLRVLPWPRQPHRLSAYVTNKLVAAVQSAQDPTAQRFVHSTVLELEVEVFL